DTVLVDVVAARAEQARSERLIGEHEAAEVAGDRLTPEAHAVEVVVRGHIAQVHLEEQRLRADRGGVSAGSARAGGAVVEGGCEPRLIVGWPEYRVTLVNHAIEGGGLADEGLLAPGEQPGCRIRHGGHPP